MTTRMMLCLFRLQRQNVVLERRAFELHTCSKKMCSVIQAYVRLRLVVHSGDL